MAMETEPAATPRILGHLVIRGARLSASTSCAAAPTTHPFPKRSASLPIYPQFPKRSASLPILWSLPTEAPVKSRRAPVPAVGATARWAFSSCPAVHLNRPTRSSSRRGRCRPPRRISSYLERRHSPAKPHRKIQPPPWERVSRCAPRPPCSPSPSTPRSSTSPPFAASPSSRAHPGRPFRGDTLQRWRT